MKNFYVSTAIPYVNGEPHLGHAMEFVMADVLARRARLAGQNVFFSTGTDEHGGKIAEKASEMGISSKQLADNMSAKFQDLAKQLNISNDVFVRTTDDAHEKAAVEIWNNLKNDIYKSEYEGWYCTGCETFVNDDEVKANNGICPDHNRKYEKLKEENYFLKLSKYNQPIKEAIEKSQFEVIPSTKRNEILNVIKEGLEDISISRPKNKIEWGITVPGDDSQVMYVWFEALINYLTGLGYPDAQNFKDFWPANIQVIGKDIIRFHAAVWPAMLMGLNLPLPKKLYVHGFINVDGQKMSKSLGNRVDPFEVIEKYGTDGFRYFFLKHIPSYNDGDFSWEAMEAAYNSELANELGNAVSRTAAMVSRYQDGEIGDLPELNFNSQDYNQALENCRFDRALEEIWQHVRGLNQYIEQQQPWSVAKTDDKEKLQQILAHQVAVLLEIAILLEPILPDTSAKINQVFKSGKIQAIDGTLFPKKED
ncbi:methionine--tRNA ligase [bacterium]|nr:methionine--tRNA ligase [bacterium]